MLNKISMLHLRGVLVLICVMYGLESKTLQNQQEKNYDTSSNDWSHQKWDSIFKHSISDKCSNETSANELDDKFSNEFINSYEKQSGKNFKDKIQNQDENALEDLLKDETFPVKDSLKNQNFEISDNADSFEIKNSGKTIKDKEAPVSGANLPRQIEGEFMKFSEDSSESTVHATLINHLPLGDPDLNNKDPSDLSSQFSKSSSESKSSQIRIQPDPTSFIFNPNAQPLDQFQNCTTPRNESGTCRYLQHCMIPSIVGSFTQFMNYVCIIEERFIGVCCPNFPVSVIVVKKEQESGKVNSTEECGISTNTRIVGGSNADPKAWPWMVALLSKSRKSFFCGGVLINHRYVLTAAHCTFGIQNNEIIARLGEYDFKDDAEFKDDHAVVEIKRHGRYNRQTLRNDVALLKLEKSVDFTEFIKAICFPEGEQTYVGENATLTGWGNLDGNGPTSDVLQVASFPVISNEKCANVHGVSMPHSLICTRTREEDKGACNGDSGGPLMLLDSNNRWKTIGLVSWGRRGCSPEFPTVYTRVSHYLKWIRRHSSA